MNSEDILYLKIEKRISEIPPTLEWTTINALANNTERFIKLAKEVLMNNAWTDIEFSNDYTGIRRLPPLPVWPKTYYTKRKTA